MALALSAWGDDVVTANKTWTFETMPTGELAQETSIDGLVIKTGSTKSSVAEETLTISDLGGESLNITKYIATAGSSLDASNSAWSKRRNAASTSTTFNNTLAFDNGKPGICYVYLKGTAKDESRSHHVLFQNGSTNAVTESKITTTEAHNAEKIISHEAITSGTFFIITGKAANVYAVRFVPEAITAPSISNNNGTITITAGESNLSGDGHVTIKTYYTTDGTTPTASSEEYDSDKKPTITEGCTIKAISVNSVTGTTSAAASLAVYKITAATNLTGGSISVNKTIAVENETVTLSNEPTSGYSFGSYTVTDGNSSAVSVENGTFTMPASNVSVTATFSLSAIQLTTENVSVEAVTYNGNEQAAVVKYNAETTLTEGTDYDVTSAENSNKGTNAGSYTFTITGKGSYTGSVEKIFTINKATLRAEADDKNKKAGEENPDLTVTVTGFVNNETAETAAGYNAPTVSTMAAAESPAGTYTITVSGGSATNYDFNYVDGTLTVNESTPVNPTLVLEQPAIGGTISADNIGELAAGTEIKLTATPASGYQLKTWKSGDESYGSQPKSLIQTISMPNSDLTITAEFELQPESAPSISSETTWTFDSFAKGTILSGTKTYVYEGLYINGHNQDDQNQAKVDGSNTAVETGISASVNNYLEIAGASSATSSTNLTTFKADAVGFYAGVPGTLKVFIKGVANDRGLKFYSSRNESATITANTTEGTNQLFEHEITAAGNVYILSTKGKMDIYAIKFIPASYTVKVSAGSNGSVTVMKGENDVTAAVATESGATYNYGTSLTLTATPETGYQFVNWTDDNNNNAVVSTENPYNITSLSANTALTANFATAGLALTTVGENGTITLKKGEEEVTTAQVGDNISVLATPNNGYYLSALTWKLTDNEGEATDILSTKTFTMPEYPVTVTAIFTESSKTDISGATVTLSETSFIYDGEPHTPNEITVNLNGLNLTLSTDYTVDKTSQTNVGTYTVIVTGKGNYTGEAKANWTIKRNLGVKLDGTQKWATYYAAEDLEAPTGVTVYKVTGVSGTTVTVDAVNYIKANTGVLLYSESDVDAGNLIVGPGSGEDYASTLLGSVETSIMNSGTNYVLYNNQFIPAEDNTLPANHCYLQIPGVSGTRSLTIEHGDDNTTGIHTTRKDQAEMENDKYYTLSGQRVEKPTKKGLYIMNGRKVVVK